MEHRNQGIKDTINRYIKEQKEIASKSVTDNKRKENSENAMIKMAEKTWIENHPFLFAGITAILGAVAQWLLQLLPPL